MVARSSSGSLIDPVRMAFLEPIARLYTTNPFEPEWEALVKAALRDEYVPAHGVGCSRAGVPSENLQRLSEPLARALTATADRLANGAAATARELSVYRGAALYGLWDAYGPRLQQLADRRQVEVPFYDEYLESYRTLLGHPGLSVPEPRHLLALLYQARRAWYYPWAKIAGSSPSAAAARAAVLRVNLGAEPCAYAGGLYKRMDEIPVLITGETGTGKDVAATSVGLSRYIAMDPRANRFVAEPLGTYHARSVCDRPRDLIESTLFGHKRGSFTGATDDSPGYFSLPKEHGTLFLDEIAELPEPAQAKLLRPLENHEIVPIGESTPRKIFGRPLFGTHKDLEAMCREGTFREDLYQRMNGMRVHMPPLRQMIAEAPGELRGYVRWFVEEMLAEPAQAEAWTERVTSAIEATAPDYGWPGNLRELRHWVDGYILSNGHVDPPGKRAPAAPAAAATRPRPPAERGATEGGAVSSSELLGPLAKLGDVTADDLESAYVTWVHVLTGQNRKKTARITGRNWRTIGKLIDPVRLLRWLRKMKKDDEEE